MGLGKEELFLLEQLQSNFRFFRKQMIDIDALGTEVNMHCAIWDDLFIICLTHFPTNFWYNITLAGGLQM